MTQKSLGMTVVTDADNHIMGVFTDGDLRRTLDRRLDVHAVTVADVMTKRCKTVQPGILAAEALHLMETHKINALPVAEKSGLLIGVLNMHDLLRAGVM